MRAQAADQLERLAVAKLDAEEHLARVWCAVNGVTVPDDVVGGTFSAMVGEHVPQTLADAVIARLESVEREDAAASVVLQRQAELLHGVANRVSPSPRLLVSGLAGSGKTTIARALRERVGDHVLVVDLDDGFSHRCDRTTGFAIPDDFPLDWTAQTWSVNIAKVEALLAATDANTPVALFGVAENIGQLMALVDAAFYLNVDGPVLAQRLATRTGNDYGKDPGELASVLGWVQGEQQRWEQRGAAIIDNNGTPDVTISALLAALT